MMSTQSRPDESPGSAPRSQGNRFFRWIDRRTGLNKLLHEALDEPIPGGARYAYIFGSGLLFVFLSQVITGIFLALYYVPSVDHAHVTVAYITKMVAAGSFLRSLHVYGASAMVIIVLMHLSQTFLYGSYKGRRELLWISGTVLFALVMGMAFTGYLLPWDQKSYFATAVGTSVASEFPLVGGFVERLMRGGNQIGTLTESIQASRMAQRAGWTVVVSHRSGETDDAFIADLATGIGCGQIKLGAPCRGERCAKFNQLLRLERNLAPAVKYRRRQRA